jgi:hypothetical protein
MAARILAVADGLRWRRTTRLPPGLRAALATRERDTEVEAELAALPPLTRCELEASFAAEVRTLARRLGV